MRTSLEEVRRVAHRLRPGVLEDLGLISALKSLISDFSQLSGVKVSRKVDPELPGLSADVELVIYRIAQEGLTNVARHAGASRVSLSLTAGPGPLTLRIVDDGIGTAAPDGAGIRGMRERALLIGARLTVNFTSTGTELELVVPERRPGL
ncbi:hypothetical protein Acor_79800 [Acrocarpospora corrugata]|uniref:histidine kinase n=1 Tax=Acrocarpospora corrugata TaxID=35763 RepID=A0A5M3WFR3_9ACTN|nr:hypothetical protein [Acrocarpospora corrugata]GES05911.1 hypothetical protein Acor_79800 [Acrocarpospora corrugata]